MKTALGKTEKITSNDSPDLQRKKIQECIVKFAEETLAVRRSNAFKKSTPWYTPEIKELAHEYEKHI